MILCSDSRVQMESFDFTPENDIFTVRNIGNQIATTPGSVEYGINHLNTPVLFIVGHSGCGAVNAAYGDYSKESPDIQKELNTIQIKSAPDVKAAILLNINNQVDAALKKFDDKIKSERLTVVGGVYDFRDDYERGDGRFIITNLNGETDPQKIEASPLFKKIKEAHIGVASVHKQEKQKTN
ncbi:Carbonic anhydrase [Candidatus Bealeia paramacronuclearis]|uniref:carbonic anhydrase n=1 Tax=Candidatus Bealeia paramacronuclearis TaxID=1921001 RepID=A0ABZ2C3N3_9PROT|nr:Carbonic anhydrase [Candidatus Bealeia paramacronuclearis]